MRTSYFFASLGLLFVLMGCNKASEVAVGTAEATAVPPSTPTGQPTDPPTPLPPATATARPTAVPTATPELGFYPPPGREFATLEDFWNGRAEFVLEIADTGLPIGESDTVYRGGTELWSYLH
ncbi:MAG: hypothetical protein P8183_09230, partial [Anaerolineae bacterium]